MGISSESASGNPSGADRRPARTRRGAGLGAALALALLAAGCLQPLDRRPGFALRGELVESLPSDWSFANEHREIAVQVSTPYGLPHSVTIYCASSGGELFLGARDPETKRWPGWVDRRDRVRLAIGGKLYDVRLEPIREPDRLAVVSAAYRAKYELPPPTDTADRTRSSARYWVVRPPD